MNKKEAATILNNEINDLREKTYTELVKIIDNERTKKVRGESGQAYQLEIQALWDNEEKEYLKVMVSVDGGENSALLMDDFVIAPSGNFVATGIISKLL